MLRLVSIGESLGLRMTDWISFIRCTTMSTSSSLGERMQQNCPLGPPPGRTDAIASPKRESIPTPSSTQTNRFPGDNAASLRWACRWLMALRAATYSTGAVSWRPQCFGSAHSASLMESAVIEETHMCRGALGGIEE
eukprot:scaffold156177_cov31-Tisochrysis_lutea.AAC.9